MRRGGERKAREGSARMQVQVEVKEEVWKDAGKVRYLVDGRSFLVVFAAGTGARAK